MKWKHIAIAFVLAAVVGIALGSLIGLLSGHLANPDKKETPTAQTEQKASTEDKKKEADKKAEEEKKAEETKKAEEDKKTSETSTEKPAESGDQNASNATKTPDTANQPAADTAAAGGSKGVVATNGSPLNLRASNQAGSNIVGSVGDGESLTILEQSNGMYRVRTASGAEAWVSSSYVSAS